MTKSVTFLENKNPKLNRKLRGLKINRDYYNSNDLLREINGVILKIV